VNDSATYRIDYAAVRKAVHAKYSDWLTTYASIEEKARETQHRLEIGRENLRELLVAVLFTRTLANVASTVLVVEHGYDVQGRALLRAAMESLFSLVAIEKDPEQAKKFVVADELERKRMLNKSRAWSAPALKAQAQQSATDDKLEEIEKAIEATGAKSISTESMAKTAGLHDWYLTAYAVFSASVHSNVRDLQRHLVLTEHNEIEEIRNEPIIEELDRLLLIASEILLKGLESLDVVFGLNDENFRSRAYGRLAKLAESLEG
jgi:hypothetical protein